MSDLDPATLRYVAREADTDGRQFRAACPCPEHSAIVRYLDSLAADLRTLAIQLEQARTVATHDVPGALSGGASQSTPDGSKGGSALLTGASAPADPEPDEPNGDDRG